MRYLGFRFIVKYINNIIYWVLREKRLEEVKMVEFEILSLLLNNKVFIKYNVF